MKKFWLFLMFISAASGLSGQNVLGFSSKEVKEYFKSNYPEMIQESGFKNDHYKYLKFTDSHTNLKTVLVFLSERDKCTSVRAIYDLSMRKEVIDELNTKYMQVEINIWKDVSQNGEIMIKYAKEEWFIVVNYYTE